MSTLQPPRGTRDLLPPESERFAGLQRLGCEIFEAAGFRRIITPEFEDTGVFQRGYGEGSEVVRKETYTFEDRSGNSLTLRADGTAPVMRAVISGSLWDRGTPLKLYYDAAMFRYERPQKGRFRQHHQLGVEAIGSEEPSLDADVIATACTFLEAAGVGSVSLSLGSMGDPLCRGEYLPKFVAYMKARETDLSEDSRRRLIENPLRIWDSKDPADIAARASAPTLLESLCEACQAHLNSVKAFLDDWGIEYKLAPNLVRGFDYYTRTTFEFASDALDSAQNAVGGGGRYDGLVESLGGPKLPGIGFGIGLERVMLAQEASGTQTPPRQLDLLVIPMRTEDELHAMRLVRQARAAGLSADLSHQTRGMKAQMKHANRLQARFAGICGETETKEGLVTLKNLESGEQQTLTFEAAIASAGGIQEAR
jgi:histidyl-tRNA synthetase